MTRFTGSGAVVVAALCSLAMGCATVSKEKGHAEVAAAIEQRTGAKTYWDEGSPDAATLEERVGKLLDGGLSRDRAIELSLLNNKRLQATYEELGISQADMVQAGLLRNPSLSGSFGFPRNAIGIAEWDFEIVQELLNLLVLPLRKRIAAQQFAADVGRVTQQALSVAAESAQHFAELQAATRQLELQQLVVISTEVARDLAEKQARAGNINALELAEHRAMLAEAKLQLAQDEQEVVEARERLNRHLGLFGPRAEWVLAQPLPELPEADPEFSALEQRAIRERLDLDAATKVSTLLQQGAQLTRTTRLMGMLAIGIHTHQDPNGPRLLGPSVELELPIFDQRQAAIARAEAQARAAERQTAALAIEIRADVRLTRSRLKLARAKVEFFKRELLPLREQALAQTQLQYNAMQIGLYALLASKREQIHAYREYLHAVRDYWVARAALEGAVGGALSAPEQQRPLETIQIIQQSGESHEHH